MYFMRVGWIAKFKFLQLFISSFTHYTYFSNLNSKLLLVNAKKYLDLHLGTCLFRYIFYLLLKSIGGKVCVHNI